MTPGRERLLERLRSRSDFKAVAKGRRASQPGLVLTAAQNTGLRPRFGFSVSRKLGGAVVRNRIRRRLREAVRRIGHSHARAGFDYVVIGRPAALNRPFDLLVADLAHGIEAVSHPRPSRAAPARPTEGPDGQ